MKDKKIIFALIAIIVIIIAGIIIMSLQGFNYSYKYNSNSTIKFKLEQEKTIEDLQSISSEVLGNKARNVEIVENLVTINVKEISEDEKQNLLNKINEKYTTELTINDLTIEKTLKVDLVSIIYDYVISIASIVGIITIYFIIKYRKQKIWKIALYSLVSIIIMQLLYFSIIAVTRIPVNGIIIPIAIIVLIITAYFIDGYFGKAKLTK